MKVRTIKFSYQSADLEDRKYRCEQITDSTEYLPGESYPKKVVDTLCASRAWKVTIVDARG